jgi:hypothetical protein
MAVDFLYNELPEYFKSILDFKYLMNTEEIELSGFEKELRRVYDNLYIQTADDQTVTEWESLLGIIRQAGDTLEWRRKLVLNMLSYVVPLTLPVLQDKLNNMLGAGTYTLVVDYAGYTIHITTEPRDDSVMYEVANTLVFMIPAHILLICLKKMSWGNLSKYTWGELEQFTWDELEMGIPLDY